MLVSRCLFILFLTLSSFVTFAHQTALLTLEGKDGFTQSFTRAQLEALPQVTYKTSTPWNAGVDEYQGPKLNDVIASFPQKIDKIQVFALNEYSYSIPAKELKNHPFILAMKKNGQPMKLREKGPLWVLLPFDKQPELLKEEYLANMCVWQVYRIKSL